MSTPNPQRKNNLLPRYHQSTKRQKPKTPTNKRHHIQRFPTAPSSTHSNTSSHSSHSSHSSNHKTLKTKRIPQKLNVSSLITKTHHPSLPHLYSNRSPVVGSKPLHEEAKCLIPPLKAGIKRTHSHDTSISITPRKHKSAPLFHQIQHDLNAYIQRFLFNASKQYWYANEYSASRDMIACTPLSISELMEIHRKSYQGTILNDDVRITSKAYIYMIDARIGASLDKVYNGIYGIFQTFVDKNNHISYIYNDKLINDKLCQINFVNIVSANVNWKDYSQQLINELSSELLGPYKSYALDKFKKLLHREFKTLTAILCIANMKKSSGNLQNVDPNNKKGHLISLLQQGIQINIEDELDDAKNNDHVEDLTPNAQKKVNMNTITECHKEIKRSLNLDTKKLNEKNKKILERIHNIKNKENKEKHQKAKHIKQETEDYVNAANEMISVRNNAYNKMKMYIKYVDEKSKTKSKNCMDEIDALFAENKKLILYGKQLLDYKFECVAYNENVARLKKEFHSKNKRFKKEIKDRIGVVKGLDLNTNETESNYLSISAKLSSIIRFSKHNMKAGTMEILKTMLKKLQNMCPPIQNDETKEGMQDIDFCEIFGCNLLHESIVLELEKQQDLCDKLLSKLQDYAVKKQKRLYIKMKQIGMKGIGARGSNIDLKGPEFEEHEYHCDDIIFRINETGEYAKGFLLVVWNMKIYRIYDSEITFQKGKEALVEHHFRATDYGYNGLLNIDVRRSRKTKKTSQFKGYQFILAKHAFVVKDMLSIKYWRNYIQRGENIRKASEDWEASKRFGGSGARGHNDENVSYNNGRRSRERFLRKTRSSSLI